MQPDVDALDLLASLTRRPAWMADAACAEPDVPLSDFFPRSGDNEAIARAKAVCERCLVAEECGAYALENGLRHGVWGGRSAGRAARPAA